MNEIFDIYDHYEDYGLRDREDQVNMSLDIAEAYVNSTNIIIEAGVGIGKSFGYLIPSLIINKKTNKPVVIATSSIQLSEQLLSDVGVISKKLGFVTNAVVGKGMSHYSCAMKTMDIFSTEGNDIKYSDTWWLIKGVTEGEYNERSEIEHGVTDKQWNTVAVNRCIFENCSFRSTCKFYRMRLDISDNGFNVDIIIINQDLLIRDLIRKNESGKGFIVTDPAMIIIDEAHNLEDKVRSALTDSFTKKDTIEMLNAILKLFDARFNDPQTIRNIKYILRVVLNFFKIINEQVNYLISENDMSSERYKVTFPLEIDYQRWNKVIGDLIVSVSVYESGKREREIDNALEELSSLKRLFEIIKGVDNNYLVWANKIGNDVSLSYCPKEIQSTLEDNLFNRKFSTVLTSATLCQGGKNVSEQYSYIKKSLGFTGDLSEPKISPFNYKDNALMYIADDTPLYDYRSKNDYLDNVCEKIIIMCNMTSGRSLVLFSSKDDLKYISEKMSTIKTSWKQIYQKEGSTQDGTIKEFRESKGVLFGTGIFWEGINIEGSDLSQVIVVRLPFPVPNDPITEYKVSISKDSFNDIMLPEMLIKLRQGTGRLIRSETDKGILSILDSRLSKKYHKHYRDAVLSSLPFKTITDSLEVVDSFCKAKIRENYI